ncbi:MAG TPA: glycosyltransferase [Vicinamibacterales bacterium]|nr:glycosyltransferase [Vicinamibacterales bacterium]
MKLAVVVQRYGVDVSGGAELEARFVAEHLARHAKVEVLTTCARDYLHWKNEFPAGVETIRGVTVRRFRVARQRHLGDFARRSHRVFEEPHSIADELHWLRSQGPVSPGLIRHIRGIRNDVDFFLFFCFRYYPSFHGVRAAADRAVLVPTAERDPAVGLSVFGPIFREARGLVYNSYEERALIQSVSGRSAAGAVIGVGSEVPERPQPWRFRKKFNVRGPFAIYVGRIDANKGCKTLFEHFTRYATRRPHGLNLILVGTGPLAVPSHPRIRALGYLPDEDKFDAIAAADVLIMPSPYESLSIVTLEAWALGRPVLVNGRCDVLRGQAIRSGGGLYYDSFEDFSEALYTLEATGPLGAVLGQNGRDYYRRHYAWPVVERKYLEMFDRLKRERAAAPMAALPGYFARRARREPPGRQIMNAAPAGAVLR